MREQCYDKRGMLTPSYLEQPVEYGLASLPETIRGPLFRSAHSYREVNPDGTIPPILRDAAEKAFYGSSSLPAAHVRPGDGGLSVLGVVGLGYLYGAAVMFFQLPSYDFLDKAFAGARGLAPARPFLDSSPLVCGPDVAKPRKGSPWTKRRKPTTVSRCTP